MSSSEGSGEVLPLTESAKCNLSAAEAYEYLIKVRMFIRRQEVNVFEP